jgi:hypothetical protein
MRSMVEGSLPWPPRISREPYETFANYPSTAKIGGPPPHAAHGEDKAGIAADNPAP